MTALGGTIAPVSAWQECSLADTLVATWTTTLGVVRVEETLTHHPVRWRLWLHMPARPKAAPVVWARHIEDVADVAGERSVALRRLVSSELSVAAASATPACALASAILVVRTANLVHAVLWLSVTLLSTAALYAMLGASFLAGVQALLERRIDTLREALSELRAVSKLMRHAGARETVAHVDELARGAVQLTLASVREMAALASSTQREALAVLARRLQADLLEFRQMQSTLRQRPPK